MTQTIQTKDDKPQQEPEPATSEREPVEDPVDVQKKAERLAELDPPRLVEAALFTAGRPVSVEELSEATGLTMSVVKQAARSLEQQYEEMGDNTSLEVGMAGAKWAMQLKTVYVEHAQSLAAMEIPKKTLKTLALIAFHQPLLQSELVDMIGSKTYDHVRELMETGLVKSRPEGLSRRLTTSPEFPEYFGIPATDTAEIRTFLAKKVGLTPAVLRGETDLEAFSGEPATPEQVEEAAREKELEEQASEVEDGAEASDSEPGEDDDAADAAGTDDDTATADSSSDDPNEPDASEETLTG